MTRQQLHGDVMTAPHFLPTSASQARPALPRLSGLVTVLASVTSLATRLVDRLHADGDAFAEAEGWQITRTRWGGRTYRHMGFVERQEVG